MENNLKNKDNLKNGDNPKRRMAPKINATLEMKVICFLIKLPFTWLSLTAVVCVTYQVIFLLYYSNLHPLKHETFL